VRTSSRPNSNAKYGLPSDASWSRASSERDNSKPRRSPSRWRNAPTLSGPTDKTVNRCSGSERSKPSGLGPPAGRREVTSTPIGSLRRRLSATSSTPAEPGSSHCKSSTATSSGPDCASARSRSCTASPIANGSGGPSPGSASNSATSNALRRGGRSKSTASPTTSPSSSERPANENAASASVPRHVKTCANRPRASSTPARHRTVLPIPGSPDSTSPVGPPPTSSRKPSTKSSSASRPITAPDITPQFSRATGPVTSPARPRSPHHDRQPPPGLLAEKRNRPRSRLTLDKSHHDQAALQRPKALVMRPIRRQPRYRSPSKTVVRVS